jgi:hypothetical protein
MEVKADDLRPGMILPGGKVIRWAGRSAMNENRVVIHYEVGPPNLTGFHPDMPVDVLGPIP